MLHESTFAHRRLMVNARIAAAKKRVRPAWSAEQWSADNFFCRRPSWPCPRADVMGRLDAVSVEEATILLQNQAFARPLLLKQDLQSDWPHVDAFQLDHLVDRYGGREFAVGSDDETGEDITLSLSDYLEYAEANADDSPLYIFDDGVLCDDDDDDDDSLLNASYAIPPCFPDDYMALMNERPPYCWLLMGAPRSGTAWHVDPLGTSAWNTLVSGRKRWFLLPPPSTNHYSSSISSSTSTLVNDQHATCSKDGYDSAPNIIGGEEGDMATTMSESSACHWLYHRYHTLPASSLRGGLDFVQRPGETVYVPSGWRHAVVNLELSVAVTHNFVNAHNVHAALEALRRDEEDEFSEDDVSRWERQLRKRGYYPP